MKSLSGKNTEFVEKFINIVCANSYVIFDKRDIKPFY